MPRKYLFTITFLLTSLGVLSQVKTQVKADSSYKMKNRLGNKYEAKVYFQITYYQVQSADISADSLQNIFSFVESKKKELGNVIVTYGYIRYKDINGKLINLDVSPYNTRKSK